MWEEIACKHTDGHRMTKGGILHPCVFVCLSCPYTIYSPISEAISNLSTDLDFLGQAGGNKTICKVMGPKIKSFIIKDLFLIVLPTYQFMPVCVFDQCFGPILSMYITSEHRFGLWGSS